MIFIEKSLFSPFFKVLSCFLIVLLLLPSFAPRSDAVAISSTAVILGAAVASVLTAAGIKMAVDNISPSQLFSFLGDKFQSFLIRQQFIPSAVESLVDLGLDYYNDHFKMSSDLASQVNSFVPSVVSDLLDSPYSTYSLRDSVLPLLTVDSSSSSTYFTDSFYKQIPNYISAFTFVDNASSQIYGSITHYYGYQSLVDTSNTLYTFYRDLALGSSSRDLSVSLLDSSSTSIFTFHQSGNYTTSYSSYPVVITDGSSYLPSVLFVFGRDSSITYRVYNSFNYSSSITPISGSAGGLSSDASSFQALDVPSDQFLYTSVFGVSGESGDIGTYTGNIIDSLSSAPASDLLQDFAATSEVAATDADISGGGSDPGGGGEGIVFPGSSFGSIWKYVQHLIDEASDFFEFIGDLLSAIPQQVSWCFYGFFVLVLFAGLIKKLLGG